MLLALGLDLFAAGLVGAVDEVDLLAVRAHDEGSAVGELHRGGLRVVEGGPVGESLGIGVACLDEVHPVLQHDLSDG